MVKAFGFVFSQLYISEKISLNNIYQMFSECPGLVWLTETKCSSFMLVQACILLSSYCYSLCLIFSSLLRNFSYWKTLFLYSNKTVYWTTPDLHVQIWCYVLFSLCCCFHRPEISVLGRMIPVEYFINMLPLLLILQCSNFSKIIRIWSNVLSNIMSKSEIGFEINFFHELGDGVI